jgi:hypothetical protein
VCAVVTLADRTSDGLGFNNTGLFVEINGWFKTVKSSVRDTTMFHIAFINLIILPDVVVHMLGSISEEFR